LFQPCRSWLIQAWLAHAELESPPPADRLSIGSQIGFQCRLQCKTHAPRGQLETIETIDTKIPSKDWRLRGGYARIYFKFTILKNYMHRARARASREGRSAG
jgi:hypothetical protein